MTPDTPRSPKEAVILRLTKQGLTLRQIGNQLGIHHKQVWNICQRMGISTSTNHSRRRKDEQLLAIATLSDRGMSFRQIAQELGLHHKTVWEKCQRYGIVTKRVSQAKAKATRFA